MAFQTQPGPVALTPAIKQEGLKGRPNLLENSEETRFEIIGYIEDGLAFSEACSLAGISRSTMYDYLSAGAKNIRAGDFEQDNSIFYLQVKRAEAQAELNALQRINKAANIPAFWGAAAWYLERRYPDRYGKQDRLNIQATSKIDIQSVNVEANLTDARAREIIAEFAKLTIPAESESVDTIPGSFSVLDDDGEIPLP